MNLNMIQSLISILQGLSEDGLDSVCNRIDNKSGCHQIRNCYDCPFHNEANAAIAIDQLQRIGEL